MNKYNDDFWNTIDELVSSSEIIIDRPKGTDILNIWIAFIELIMDI